MSSDHVLTADTSGVKVSYQRYTKRVLAVGSLLIGGVFLGNVLIDPFDVFDLNILPQKGEMQVRLRKVDYLINHPAYDTFLFGSSRVGTIAPGDVEALFPNYKVYNFSLDNGNQWDNLKHVQWLLQAQPGTKRVFLQVDYPESYGQNREGYELITKLHPALSGESWASFYKSYIVSLSFPALKRKLANNFGSIAQVDFSLENGSWDRPIREQALRKNCAAYSAGEYTFLERVQRSGSSDAQRRIIEQNVEAIKTMKELADQRGVEFHIYTTPHHAKFLDHINLDDYVFFLQELAKVSPFWNFAYYSVETTNNCNYQESSHFRRLLGPKIFQTFKQDGSASPTFGRWVSADNVTDEATFIRTNFSGR